jgi:hypothetical protein
MDELLRQKIGGHQASPSTGVWEGIAGRLPGNPLPAWRLWLNTLILPLSVLLLTGGIYLIPSANGNVEMPGKQPSQLATSTNARLDEKPMDVVQPVDEPFAAIPTSLDEAETSSTEHTPTPLPASPAAPSPAISRAASHSQENTPTPLPDLRETIHTPLRPQIPATQAAQAKPVASPSVNPIKEEQGQDDARLEVEREKKTASVPHPSAPLPAIFVRKNNPEGTQKPLSLAFRKEAGPIPGAAERTPAYLPRLETIWSLGLFYNPELYYSKGNYAEKTLWSADALISFRRFNYSFETGLGIGRIRNENLYIFDYNAYLGSYLKLDSIAFQVDTANQTIVPEYFFDEVPVYDSVTSQTYQRTTNHYTYLQIPAFLVYRYPLGRLSLSLRGGPMLSILIGEKEPVAYLDETSGKLLRIDNNRPGRLSTHWQFLLNAGVGYQLSPRLMLSVEPGLRFYLNPVYQEETYKPWSVQLRSGLIYTF